MKPTGECLAIWCEMTLNAVKDYVKRQACHVWTRRYRSLYPAGKQSRKKEREREQETGRERECRGIMSSHNPPFDTTREALVSLNNPCWSIKFAD